MNALGETGNGCVALITTRATLLEAAPDAQRTRRIRLSLCCSADCFQLLPSSLGDIMTPTSRLALAHRTRSILVHCSSRIGKGRDLLPLHALNRIGRAGVLLLLAIGMTTGIATSAAAQTSLPVEPGAEILIDSGEKALVDKSANIKGKISTDQLGKAPALHRLLYRAPADASVGLTETIRYEKDGAVREASVRVVKPGEGATQPLALSEAFKVLVQLFVLAVLLEQALSVIFNWRPFLQNFDARGVKTIVSVLVAWFVVETFKLDLVVDLVNVYAVDKAASGFSTKLLTALILAGGSSGVNNVLVSLGFRSMRTADQIVPRPPHKDAWIAVRLIRDKAVGPVFASMGPDGARPPVAGVIAGSSKKNGLLRYLLVDRGRFPVVGGFSLTPDPSKQYVVQLDGEDSEGNKLTSKQWGPYPIAAGAIIDVDIRL